MPKKKNKETTKKLTQIFKIKKNTQPIEKTQEQVQIEKNTKTNKRQKIN